MVSVKQQEQKKLQVGSSFIHDAKTVCDILGLPNNCNEESPQAANGEIVVWYGGWTLGQLVATGKVVNYVSKEEEVWKAPPGYYHAHLPVPKSNRMTHDRQITYLSRRYAGLQELPTAVGATALAVHFGVTSEDLLKGSSCRCAEVTLSYGYCAALRISGDCVLVSYYWSHRGYDDVFLGAVRKS